jgi:hypothetical protein
MLFTLKGTRGVKQSPLQCGRLPRRKNMLLAMTRFVYFLKEDEMTEENTRREEFEFSGDKLISQIKELINEGNIRRIIIKSEEGRALINIPLTVGILGTLVAPQLAALGAIAALVTHGTIVVEKTKGSAEK